MARSSQAFFNALDGDVEDERNEPNDFLHLLVSDLKELYWFEKNLLKIIAKMQKASSSKSLNILLADYLIEDNLNIERLEQIFMFISEIPKANKSNLYEEFLSDINDILMKTKYDDALRDDCFFCMLNKMDKFKTTCYEGVIALAIQIGNDDMITLLEENKKSALQAKHY